MIGNESTTGSTGREEKPGTHLKEELNKSDESPTKERYSLQSNQDVWSDLEGFLEGLWRRCG